MPGHGCSSTRKHTPIVSKKQRGLFGAEYARRKAGEKGRMPGITTAELRSHLKESADKTLPVRTTPKEPRSETLRKSAGRRAMLKTRLGKKG